MLPSFLIVGAQRCGTTSLYRALAQHPELRKPVFHKGVHYFDVAYDKGLGWYRAHFPIQSPGMAFESSPYYLFHPLAAARIARDLPEVRLIVLVRDPVERAASAHAHEHARGFEPEPIFERALELEDGRLAGEAARLRSSPYAVSHAHQHQAYLGRGRYAEQLARLEPLFGRERVLVVDSGRLFADPTAAYARVLRFLEMPWHPAAFSRHNARPRPPLPQSVRRRLDDHFAPFDAALTPWLGAVPSWRA
ncbi:sulfotransferase [Streptosporangiaceae bacterium NEAU-GS5]|nr:sulfotransferase [Streptosporangiaceae bacterium NEAU-GS5]